MGTGVAVSLVSTMKQGAPSSLILMSPYYSIKEVVKSRIGCFGACLVKDHFNSGELISSL
jgi:hypothetical protein